VFRIRRDPESGLIICLLQERFNRDEIVGEIESAFRRELVRPRQNRLTVIDPKVDLSNVAVAELTDIQTTVAQLETGSASWSPLLSVFYGTRASVGLALQIYEMLWEREPYVQGRFFHTESLVVAEQLLGVAGLEAKIAAMAEQPPSA
jgi:hypothetical protein